MTSVRIAIVGDFDASFEPHPLTQAALAHSACALGVALEQRWLDTEELPFVSHEALIEHHGLLIGPGSPNRNPDGRSYMNPEAVIDAVQLGREGQVPTLATCGGYQHLALEYSRNVLGIRDATATYYSNEGTPVIVPLACSLRDMTLPIRIEAGSRAADAYGTDTAEERYYCRYGVGAEYQKRLHAAGLRISGVDANDGEARIVELGSHPYFVGTCFVPQARSSPQRPHPLIMAFVAAAAERSGTLRRVFA